MFGPGIIGGMPAKPTLSGSRLLGESTGSGSSVLPDNHSPLIVPRRERPSPSRTSSDSSLSGKESAGADWNANFGPNAGLPPPYKASSSPGVGRSQSPVDPRAAVFSFADDSDPRSGLAGPTSAQAPASAAQVSLRPAVIANLTTSAASLRTQLLGQRATLEAGDADLAARIFKTANDLSLGLSMAQKTPFGVAERLRSATTAAQELEVFLEMAILPQDVADDVRSRAALIANALQPA